MLQYQLEWWEFQIRQRRRHHFGWQVSIPPEQITEQIRIFAANPAIELPSPPEEPSAIVEERARVEFDFVCGYQNRETPYEEKFCGSRQALRIQKT